MNFRARLWFCEYEGGLEFGQRLVSPFKYYNVMRIVTLLRFDTSLHLKFCTNAQKFVTKMHKIIRVSCRGTKDHSCSKVEFRMKRLHDRGSFYLAISITSSSRGWSSGSTFSRTIRRDVRSTGNFFHFFHTVWRNWVLALAGRWTTLRRDAFDFYDQRIARCATKNLHS